MSNIAVGMKLNLMTEIDDKRPAGSTATVIFLDDFDQVFVEWTEGGQSSFTEDQLVKNFEVMIG